MKRSTVGFGERLRRHGAVCALLLVPAMATTGCAHSQHEVSKQNVDRLQSRLEEVERTNGRLTVRVEELETQVMLVQDRIETNRLALQRRGALRSGEDSLRASNDAQPLQPSPESYYGDNSGYMTEPTRQRVARRPVGRIELSEHQSGRIAAAPEPEPQYIEMDESDPAPEDDGEDVVITDADFRAFAGEPARPTPNTASAASGTMGRVAQAPVTSERLATSRELAEKPAPAKPREGQSLLSVYQDSLAEYRAGNYQVALQGFESFLQAGPRADYIDNALYWIGECHYGLGEYDTSVKFFQRILDELPQAGKVPDAMLKMSLAYDRLGKPADAVDLLVKLTDKYPSSNPGRLGAKRLEDHPSRP